MEHLLADCVPKLASKARLKYDKVRDQHLLLLPEKVVALNESAAVVLNYCDGHRNVRMIAEHIMASMLANVREGNEQAKPDLPSIEADISAFVQDMADQGWVVI